MLLHVRVLENDFSNDVLLFRRQREARRRSDGRRGIKRCVSAAADTDGIVRAPDVVVIIVLRLQLGALGDNSPCSMWHGGTLFIRNDRGDLGNEAGATLEGHVTP